MKLPLLAVRIFVSHMPTGDVYLYSISESSGMRTLFFACHILGSMALCTFFSSASGARSKRAPAEENDNPDCQFKDFGEKLGRLIVVGVGSALLAALPISLLAKLHRRRFVLVEYEECDEWKWTLWKWRNRDRLIWFCGTIYCTFCAHFVMLFFASVVPDDQFDWIVSSIISLNQELMLLPLLTAIAFPVISMIFLIISAVLMQVHRSVVLVQHAAVDVANMIVEDREVNELDEDSEEVNAEEGAVRKVPSMPKEQPFLSCV
eukprot:TRINITY_DN9018_c1_g1_i6.p1 TRINITY_DN9018_c1_g1~~TRINITY_DN9018_c1_g1_i6.p1  ORF type:complete len:262 (+),score=45.90 TRINITY_DN9018_c1_g1_i6:1-786(+)